MNVELSCKNLYIIMELNIYILNLNYDKTNKLLIF